MNLTISYHHVTATPTLALYTRGKLARATRHCDMVTSIDVLLSIDTDREKMRAQTAKAIARLKGKSVVVEESRENLYIAIDALSDRLCRELCEHKSRMKRHRVQQTREPVQVL